MKPAWNTCVCGNPTRKQRGTLCTRCETAAHRDPERERAMLLAREGRDALSRLKPARGPRWWWR